ncbi:MAG TPA: sialidase family protein [Candidatus Dormibacteraeota bacterium]|nr:sialidase family protein [Candidatus Dormibacteraeota bacterium]
MTRLSALPLAVAAVLIAASTVLGTGGDALVSNGSPPSPFSQNKQNEPAITNDANHPSVLVAGSNDEIDEEACNAGNDTRCPFTPGIGVSGVYFSFDSGQTWVQPTYTGLTARGCQGVVGNSDPPCTPQQGPIGTLPWYFENGLVSDGDPGLAFGPRPGANGFSWANGSRLYYSNLTSNLPTGSGETAFNGFEAIAVSRTDNVQAAAAGDKNAWMAPVLVSHQNNTTFSDKEQIWADNASSSPFFGNVYVCWADFQGQEKSPNAAPAQLKVAVSSDGGATWSSPHPIGAAANNGQRNPLDGCTVRTASNGTAYVFGVGTLSSGGHASFELMSTSTNGGGTWSSPTPVAGPVTQPGLFDPVLGRPTIDGIAGARSDLAPAPSVDIANGAPTGSDATNRIVMSYVSGSINTQDVFFTESADGGNTWSAPRAVESAGDHGVYAAPAISPNGTTVYVVYNAFTTPYQDTTATPRVMVGVIVKASVGSGGTGAFSSAHRGAPGDPRGSSQNNLVGEFIGDYVYATATRTYGAAVWNDARNDADCPAIDAWRMSLRNGTSVPRPAPQQDCPATFGNLDIFGGTA